MKCQRPTCLNKAKRGGRGYCYKHYHALPDSGYVDSAGCIEHLGRLRAKGYSLERLAQMTGLSRSTFQNMGTYTERACVEMRVRNAIFAVPIPDEIIAGGSLLMDGTGTRRRLQALSAIGHTQDMLAPMFGVAPQAVGKWAVSEQVSAATVVRVREVFAKLHMIPGTNRISIARARTKGWLPPLAWDEDEIDDPDAQPHLVKGSKGDWVPRMREYQALGMSVRAMAQMEGITPHAINKRLERLDAA
jgi:hypothetical protein